MLAEVIFVTTAYLYAEGVYSLHIFRSYVLLFSQHSVSGHLSQKFIVKIFKTSYYQDLLMDLVSVFKVVICSSQVLILTILNPQLMASAGLVFKYYDSHLMCFMLCLAGCIICR